MARRAEYLRSDPYVIHTNRELGLMLKGLKPVAAFSWVEGHQVDSVRRYLRMFDRHVSMGRFTKHERVRSVPQLPHLRYHQIYYTLPGEDWRVEALTDLLDGSSAWTADRERRLGELLGYEDWQNDLWLANFKEAD